MKEAFIAIVFGIVLFYVAKYIAWPIIKIAARYIFCLMKWLLITSPVWLVWLMFFDDVNPRYIFWSIVGISIVDFLKKLKNKEPYYSGEHYVLNTKSKIAHSSWDSSANTIGYNHRKEVYATKEELFDQGYRMKQNK